MQAFINREVERKQRMTQRIWPGTCDIVRIVETQDFGGTTETPTTIATGVKCFYSEDLSPQDVERGAAQEIVINAKLILPAGQDITAKDRVTVTMRAVVLGTYEVSSVIRQDYEVQRVAYLEGPI
jgi:hypothetical protein